MTDSPHTSLKCRLLIGVITLFFGAQLWVAGSYYLGDYPWDERFSWRMFSTVRSLSCQPQLWSLDPTSSSSQICPDGQTLGCRPLRLSTQYHMVWVNLLKRGRLQVLDAVARDRCEALGEGGAVFVGLNCPSPTPPHQMVEVQSPKVNLCREPRRRSLEP